MDSQTIQRLYASVLHEDVQIHIIPENSIRKAINNMKEVYKPDPTSLQSDTVDVADYDDVVHRCAYLHKYAPLHTALVSEMLRLALMDNVHVFRNIIAKHGCFNVCSLGGGPGNDVIAGLDVLNEALGFFQVNATVLDIMVGWKYTFQSILKELQYGDYGDLSDHVSDQYFTWKYEQANLLGKMNSVSNKAIASANLITMVKFVSASSCKDTANMIGKIFRSMKHGAVVLYIDNAGGGFHQMVTRQAQACRLSSLYGPLKHYDYSNPTFNVKRFGYTPCLETTVSVQLWMKPFSSAVVDNYVNSLESGWMGSFDRPSNVDVVVVNQNYPERSRARSGGRTPNRDQNRSRRPRSQPRRAVAESGFVEEDNNTGICCCVIS